MTVTIGRRELVAALGGAAAAWPLAARAQQPAVPVVGILAVASPEANAIRLRAFREGLSAAGYVEGQNVNIEYRWAEAHTGRLPEPAARFVEEQVAVLVQGPATHAAGAEPRRFANRAFGEGLFPRTFQWRRCDRQGYQALCRYRRMGVLRFQSS